MLVSLFPSTQLSTIIIAQSGGSGGVRSLGNYWKQLLTVTVSSFFMFIYEFCERYTYTCTCTLFVGNYN